MCLIHLRGRLHCYVSIENEIADKDNQKATTTTTTNPNYINKYDMDEM